MKRIILAAALFSIFSSVLSPITASALPVGNGWGTSTDAIVEKLVKQGNNIGEREKKLLSEIIIPERIDLFRNREDRFLVGAFSYPFLRILGLGSGCNLFNPHEKDPSFILLSCSINGK
ncbi:hypothetical protein NPX99_08395 [Bartonella sp. 220]|uniref:hypothetical protein n=1 Tax=Bartonella sp. 220B TaxID=2967260 RepID=UPI0022A8FFF6|nr:hypothetical protein [Bartonella sp. 220B]MCZ2159253.1 hypothetical protein [Bartonella sp. 220B]